MKKKANKGFFILESVPGVQFLNGTSFDQCKPYGATLKDFNKVHGIVKKKEKPILKDKSLKKDLDNK